MSRKCERQLRAKWRIVNKLFFIEWSLPTASERFVKIDLFLSNPSGRCYHLSIPPEAALGAATENLTQR